MHVFITDYTGPKKIEGRLVEWRINSQRMSEESEDLNEN